MRRTFAFVIGAIVAAALTLSPLGAPASAQEADTRQPTAIVGGAYVVTVPLGRILTASAALFDGTNTHPFMPRVPNRTIVFTSGGLPVCTAVTGDGDLNWGTARCAVNLLSPGGLMALLTGRIEASFAGDASYQPSSGTLRPIGPDAPAALPA